MLVSTIISGFWVVTTGRDRVACSILLPTTASGCPKFGANIRIESLLIGWLGVVSRGELGEVVTACRDGVVAGIEADNSSGSFINTSGLVAWNEIAFLYLYTMFYVKKKLAASKFLRQRYKAKIWKTYFVKKIIYLHSNETVFTTVKGFFFDSLIKLRPDFNKLLHKYCIKIKLWP